MELVYPCPVPVLSFKERRVMSEEKSKTVHLFGVEFSVSDRWLTGAHTPT